MLKKLIKISLVVIVVLIAAGYFGLKKNIDLEGMQVHQTPHFTIHHEGLAAGTLQEMESRLEANCGRLRDFFGVDESDKGTIVVYSSVGRFQRAYLGLILAAIYGDWAAGGAYHEMVLITSPDQPGSEQTYEGMMEILLHEYVHTLVYAVNDWPDIWLDEGLATYLSGQAGVLPDTLPGFEAMQSQSMGEFVDNNGYAVARSYVQYLIDTYGSEKVVGLVRTNDYESRLGKSKRAVYDEWAASVTGQRNK